MILDVLVTSAIRARQFLAIYPGDSLPPYNSGKETYNDDEKKRLLCHGEVRPKQERSRVRIEVLAEFLGMLERIEHTADIDTQFHMGKTRAAGKRALRPKDQSVGWLSAK